MTPPARLLEAVGALSVATDQGIGAPAEAAMRTSIVAARLAGLWRHDAQFVRECQLTAILRYLGCTSAAHEAALLNAGDDQGFIQLFAAVDLGRPLQVMAVAPKVAKGAPLGQRLRTYARFADPAAPEEIVISHCEVASGLAMRLGAGAGVAAALGQMSERWDGRGVPARLRGAGIAPVARVVAVAQVFEVIWRIGGAAAAVKVIDARAGGQLDPELAATVAREHARLADGLDAPSLMEALLAEEPAPHAALPEERLLDVAAAFAHVADLKSTWTIGHSLAVADLAERCAGPMRLREPARLRVAALLHDLGRVGLPNRLWDKPGALTSAERARVEEHAWATERILRATPILAPFAEWVGVHERLDGTGYHRRVRALSIPAEARLLAACDVHAALLADRAHRRALGKGEAARVLGEEARAGRLDREAVRVLLEVVGQPLPKLRGELPHGLSPREVEVLALVARGRSNKEIGERLHVAERTVKNHVARLYAKVGVRTRAAAALFASEHGLLEAGAFEN